MQAIRKINPAAKLIQTEDLCKVHSTPVLAYQAEFENERRWLTYDLLCGKFRPGHPFWDHFLSLGIPETYLIFFVENTCPPDIMGFNYYLTSERYLDDNLENYPPHLIGGNGRHRYADTDAARANMRHGPAVLLQEAWERYRLPMAVTECHLNCTREEQMRWFKEIWDACRLLNFKGIPVKALTAWSLLGSFDWDSLLLQQNGHYESGVFDTSAGYLRPTLLAKMVRAFAEGQSFDHPLLAGKGWWHDPVTSADERGTPPLLIASFDTSITADFEQVCRERRIWYQPFSFALQTGSNKPWGVILVVNHWQAQSVDACEPVSTYCRRQQIPLMVVTGSIGCMHEDHHLLVNNEGADGMKFAHHAMDLFIDGEKGHWRMDKCGARKNEFKEPSLSY
jgi:dTDP-4-dehydrorhamnose reductase